MEMGNYRVIDTRNTAHGSIPSDTVSVHAPSCSYLSQFSAKVEVFNETIKTLDEVFELLPRINWVHWHQTANVKMKFETDSINDCKGSLREYR